MNPTNAQLQAMINDLPLNIQKAIHEFDWANEVMKIGRAHQLQIDDIEKFRTQTLLVMLGQSPADAYERNLAMKLGINAELAASLVSEANHQIFSELQRRAFQKDMPEETSEASSPQRFDDYLEPIEHEDLAGVMRNEGIELIAHDEGEPVVPSPLGDEVSRILGTSGNETSTDASEKFSKVKVVGFGDEEDEIGIAMQARNDRGFARLSAEQVGNDNRDTKTSSYQETIEASDLEGVKNRSVDMSVLKKPSQLPPEQVFQNDTPTQSTRDLGQKKILDQSLDQHIMENPFLAKGDTVDASPKGAEALKEEKGYLGHLAE